MKWRWIEKQWSHREDWIKAARSTFHTLMLEYDVPVNSPLRPTSRCVPTSLPLKRKRKSQAAEWFNDEVSDEEEQPTRAMTLEQQMAVYNNELRSQTVRIEHSPTPYWLQQRNRWPQLTTMALDLYATPAMSDEPERKFSETGAATSPRRRLLDEQTIAWLMCLKSWSNTGLVTFDKALFAAVPTPMTTVTTETSPIPVTGRIQSFYPHVIE